MQSLKILGRSSSSFSLSGSTLSYCHSRIIGNRFLSSSPREKHDEIVDSRYLYSLHVHHKSLNSNQNARHQRKRLEQEAWRCLQSIPDTQVAKLSTSDLAECLSTWVYFAKFWGNGMNGPSVNTCSDSLEENQEEDLKASVPLVSRQSKAGKRLIEANSLPPRSNPLDEVIDF